MIDLLRLQIFVKEQFWTEAFDEFGQLKGGHFDTSQAMDFGFTLSGEVSMDENNAQEVHSLKSKFQSIKSSNSSLAFMIYQGGDNYFPHVELKASPAKLLQGHNVYGSDDLELCANALLYSFVYAFPNAHELFDFKHINIKQIDCTYSVRLKNESQVKQVIDSLRNISTRYIRPASSYYDTTVYFNPNSTRYTLKAYAKSPELQREIKELSKKSKRCGFAKRKLEAIKKSGCESYAENLLRFEASIKDVKLKTYGFKTDLDSMKALSIKHTDQNNSFIYKLWLDCFNPIFETFKGHNMNIHDDETIKAQLEELYKREIKPCSVTGASRYSYAKATRIFGFYRRIKNEGFYEVKRTLDRMNFSRYLRDLTAVVSKQQLMNFDTQVSNVVPLLNLIDIDFNHQLPTDYKEPQPMNEQLMKLVG